MPFGSDLACAAPHIHVQERRRGLSCPEGYAFLKDTKGRGIILDNKLQDNIVGY